MVMSILYSVRACQVSTGSLLCLCDTEGWFTSYRWGQCWLNDLLKSTGVPGRTILWACLTISSSPCHKYHLNTVFFISYNVIWTLGFMDLDTSIFYLFQFYKNTFCWVCEGSFCFHTNSCILEASKQGRKEQMVLFVPSTNTKLTALKSL